ncbi:MAG: hypothetical protein WAP37_01355 [Solirubrobacterales bacterium]
MFAVVCARALGSGDRARACVGTSVASLAGICVAIALSSAALALTLPPDSARASVELAPYGSGSDLRPGGHAELVVGANFTYDSASEDVRRVVIDFPAGGAGNPNAIPWDERCTRQQFETSVCPASSQIGVVSLDAVAADTVPLPLDLTGTISLIQTDPEVPTLVGGYVESPIGDPVRSYATFYPVTAGPDGDFRIRSVTSDFPRETGGLPIRIDRYEQRIFGVTAAGATFITNPTRCDPWISYGYAQAWDSNDNADADPLMTGVNEFKRSEPVPIQPTCDAPPFNTIVSARVSSGKRNASPDLLTTIEIPGIYNAGISPSVPKSIVATLPASINVDVQQIGRLCPRAALTTDACPPFSRVGSVFAETPLIRAGLTGEAFLTSPATPGALPDLSLVIRGAVNFHVTGSNRYVNRNQLQTTFDNLPQPGFSKFTLKIDGGPGGLLKTLGCPAGNKRTGDGPMTFDLRSYMGQTLRHEAALKFDTCAGIVRIKRIRRCVGRTLRVSPAYRERGEIRFARLYVDHRKKQTVKRSPFRFKVSARRYKAGRHKITVRAFYRDNQVAKRNASFKRCGR